ncbi:MAG: SH3 domain-containing protein [Bacteroidales bacterium]|nr:SH3 domain-containing protein [Bacteroidales bacterium]
MAKYKVITKSSNLNVRQEPNINAPVIGKLAKGSEVVGLEEISGWCKVELEDGKVGYSSLTYLEKISELNVTSLF